MNYLMWTYTTGQDTADTENEIALFIQLSNKTSSLCAEILGAETLSFEGVYKEQDLNEIFIKGRGQSIRQNVKKYFSTPKISSLHSMDFQATSLMKL